MATSERIVAASWNESFEKNETVIPLWLHRVPLLRNVIPVDPYLVEVKRGTKYDVTTTDNVVFSERLFMIRFDLRDLTMSPLI
jgi:hypothetical protein